MRTMTHGGRRTPWSGARPCGGLALWLVLAALCLGLGGCGYTQKEIYPTDVRTVAVLIFANRTFYRGVEFDLTEALIKEIELRTPYKVVPQERADTILQGTVIGVEQRELSSQLQTGLPQEIEVRVAVDFVWKNLRTGKALKERSGFAAVGRYIPASPAGEGLSAGQHAAVQKLATDLVSALQADW